MYHPNFDKEGNICLDLLRKDNWSPMCGVQEIIVAFGELLKNPTADHPLAEDVAEVLQMNRTQFDKTAKEWTKKHA